MLTQPGELARRGRAAGLTVVFEAFADRAYRPDGRLVPRASPGAVLGDPADAVRQALDLVGTGGFGSLCVHGDTPGAPTVAQAVRAALTAAGHEVAPFAGAR